MARCTSIRKNPCKCAGGTVYGLLFLGAAAGATYLFLTAPDAVNCGQGWGCSILALLFGVISFSLFKSFDNPVSLDTLSPQYDSDEKKPLCPWWCRRRQSSLVPSYGDGYFFGGNPGGHGHQDPPALKGLLEEITPCLPESRDTFPRFIDVVKDGRVVERFDLEAYKRSVAADVLAGIRNGVVPVTRPRRLVSVQADSQVDDLEAETVAGRTNSLPALALGAILCAGYVLKRVLTRKSKDDRHAQ